jgi:hypothetical protein
MKDRKKDRQRARKEEGRKEGSLGRGRVDGERGRELNKNPKRFGPKAYYCFRPVSYAFHTVSDLKQAKGRFGENTGSAMESEFAWPMSRLRCKGGAHG